MIFEFLCTCFLIISDQLKTLALPCLYPSINSKDISFNEDYKNNKNIPTEQNIYQKLKQLNSDLLVKGEILKWFDFSFYQTLVQGQTTNPPLVCRHPLHFS